MPVRSAACIARPTAARRGSAFRGKRGWSRPSTSTGGPAGSSSERRGVFYSDDGGATLQSGSVGLAEGRVSDLVADPNDPNRVFFFRAYAGQESGVWEAQGTRVRRLSLDLLPPAASLAVFRGTRGETILLLSSFVGLKVSSDGGERWTAPDRAPGGTPIALFGSEFGSPVLVTTAGVYRTVDGRNFTLIAGSHAAPPSAELLSTG